MPISHKFTSLSLAAVGICLLFMCPNEVCECPDTPVSRGLRIVVIVQPISVYDRARYLVGQYICNGEANNGL